MEDQGKASQYSTAQYSAVHHSTVQCSTAQYSTVQYSVVQVSQYSCDDEYVAAQIGCFQYFTGLTGTLQSYNFAGAAQIKVQT